MHMLVNRDQEFEWPQAVEQIAEQVDRLNPGLFKDQPLLRLTVLCRPQNLLEWLNAQDFETRIFWADREQRFRVAGVGKADEIFIPQDVRFLTPSSMISIKNFPVPTPSSGITEVFPLIPRLPRRSGRISAGPGLSCRVLNCLNTTDR